MKVIIKKPYKKPIYCDIPNELDALQEIVRGYVEAVAITPDFVVLCNEEGRIDGMPHCWEVGGIDFCGPVILCGVDGPEFADVPFSKELIDQLLETEDDDNVEC